MLELKKYSILLVFSQIGFIFSQQDISFKNLIFKYEPFYNRIRVVDNNKISEVSLPDKKKAFHISPLGRHLNNSYLFIDKSSNKVVFIEWTPQAGSGDMVRIQGALYAITPEGGLVMEKIIEERIAEFSTGPFSALKFPRRTFKKLFKNEGFSEAVLNEIYKWLDVKRLQRIG